PRERRAPEAPGRDALVTRESRAVLHDESRNLELAHLQPALDGIGGLGGRGGGRGRAGNEREGDLARHDGFCKLFDVANDVVERRRLQRRERGLVARRAPVLETAGETAAGIA